MAATGIYTDSGEKSAEAQIKAKKRALEQTLDEQRELDYNLRERAHEQQRLIDKSRVAQSVPDDISRFTQSQEREGARRDK